MPLLKTSRTRMFWAFQGVFFAVLSYCIWTLLHDHKAKTPPVRVCKGLNFTSSKNHLYKYMQTLDDKYIEDSIDDTTTNYSSMTSDWDTTETSYQ
ncbi:hypothetical protein NEPAR06_2091 [Nematocida parisii]|uniref:Uncharacterized protein n=1 Tax=Nematocida parisii (strain ERTm3) TaxID=935791 RepID=I3EG05_NEMP3|nr:uncharacterized protein NEPG_01354 [Nematocida parisii ERTm1]EIJ88152.1 hypothetical protein NEQG_01596 [Nematocida parisii ERTm3]KAI5130186.1 hypothetical protein NEPAR08_1896 [Nematocida parisii]EIJ93782.1 hypothetical protein NEPG_01354 [Nematocida parisii ERTm1]KAI5130216.1 hypothetical protein NEPAR03_2002 [Nematocida parisii]KAI5143808.1 hypothetical protein NEPAR04_1944 [Nematocida parisii]|eukprot:XP_013059182.1 hypothetical protein NEPG_01354 [Nematocida parisii ERTm1]